MRASRLIRPFSRWPVALACALGAWSTAPAFGQTRAPAAPGAAASSPAAGKLPAARVPASRPGPAGVNAPGVPRAAAAPGRKASEPAQSVMDAPMFYDILMGEILDQQGDAASAAQFFQDAATRSRDPRLYARLFSIAMRQQDGKEALRHAREWQVADPGSTDALRAMLVAQMGQRAYADMEAPLRQLLLGAKDTELPPLLEALPNWLGPQIDPAVTLKITEAPLRALAQQASRPAGVRQGALVALARFQWRAKKQVPAADSLRQAEALDPGQWLVARVAAEWLAQQPSLESLLRQYLSSSKDAAQAEQVRTNLASFLVEKGRMTEAYALLKAQTELTPESPYAWFNWGVSLRDQGRDAEAETCLSRFWALLDTSPAESLRGVTQEMRIRAARILVERAFFRDDRVTVDRVALQADPQQADALIQYWRARGLAMEGQWQEGLTLLSGVQLPPGREAALPFLKGRYLLEAGQWQAAAGILEEGLKLHPSHVEMTLNLSTAYERLGRREDAVRMMERAVQLDPGNASYLNGLGYLLIDLVPDRGRARILIEQALAKSPDHPAYQDSMGWLLFREGQPDMALQWLRKSWSRLKDAEVAAHLGEVLWSLGQREEARQIWDEAEKAGASSPQSLEALRQVRARLIGSP